MSNVDPVAAQPAINQASADSAMADLISSTDRQPSLLTPFQYKLLSGTSMSAQGADPDSCASRPNDRVIHATPECPGAR